MMNVSDTIGPDTIGPDDISPDTIGDNAGDNVQAPAIRFKGFSAPWEERALGEIGSFKSGVGFPEAEQNGKLGIPYYKVSDMNLDGNQQVMAFANNYVNEEQIDRLGYKLINEKSIIFAKVGAAIFLERKRIASNFLIDNNMMSFSTTEDVVFIKLWFDSIKLSKYVQVGALPSYNASDLNIIELCVPTKLEQKKIGQYFQQLDRLIALHQQKHDKLCHVKKALLDKIFPKQGRDTPDIRFKGFSAPWEERALEEIGSFKSGVGFPEAEQNGKLGIPYYKVSDMNLDGNQQVMAFANNYVNEEQIDRLGYKLINEKSIIFAKVGAAIFLERKRIASNFLIDNNMMSFSTTEDVVFIKLWFDTIKLSKYVQVGALPSYNASDLNIIELCVPTKLEQTKIGNLFQRLDTLINQHQSQIKKLGHIKQACLAKMFV